MNAYYVPGTVLRVVRMLTRSVLTTALQGLKGSLIKYGSTSIMQTGGTRNSDTTTF